MIKTIEIDENFYWDFDRLDPELQDDIKNSYCVRCDKTCNDKKDLMYVKCDNGQVRWWHHKRNFWGQAC